MFSLLRQRQDQPHPALPPPHLSPTSLSAVVSLHSSSNFSSSNKSHLPQPPATHCLNKLPAFPRFFVVFIITMLRKSQIATSFFYNIYAKKRRTLINTKRQTKILLTWSTLSQVFTPKLLSFVIHRQKDSKRKYHNHEPVYARLTRMHNLWIIYFYISVQIIGEQERRQQLGRLKHCLHNSTATDWQWCFILYERFF